MRRFANSSCPVCTHTHSFVFNDLGCSHSHQKTSVASYSAPRVHQESHLTLPMREFCRELFRSRTYRLNDRLSSEHFSPSSVVPHSGSIRRSETMYAFDAKAAMLRRAWRLLPALAAILIPASVLSKKSAMLSRPAPERISLCFFALLSTRMSV